MMSREVFYFFVLTWMSFIGSIPGVMLTFLFAGVFAQLLNYLPSQKDKTKQKA